MNRVPLRHLLTGPAVESDRVLFHGTWFRGHNNQRYAWLLPRLTRVDACLLVCSDRRLLRGLQIRALNRSSALRQRITLAAAGKRYRSLLAADRNQIRYFPGAVVADCDDPKFTEREVDLLKRPNLRAYVVVNDRVAVEYRRLGVEKPCYVIPHGVSLGSIDAGEAAATRRRHRADGDLVVGYMAAWMLSQSDRGGRNSKLNVDHLLELWDEIHTRLPQARLWLMGGASDRVRRRCEGRGDIILHGRIPPDEVLSYVGACDIALYPRTADEGYQASKVIEYMGCGVPTVSYDYEVTSDLREAGAGLMARTPREFVGAVERLAHDEALRRELQAAARAAAAARDWDVLAREYEAVLDRHLEP
jgi:glycosyltransferase involved in cell wall biosynthesis